MMPSSTAAVCLLMSTNSRRTICPLSCRAYAGTRATSTCHSVPYLADTSGFSSDYVGDQLSHRQAPYLPRPMLTMLMKRQSYSEQQVDAGQCFYLCQFAVMFGYNSGVFRNGIETISGPKKFWPTQNKDNVLPKALSAEPFLAVFLIIYFSVLFYDRIDGNSHIIAKHSTPSPPSSI